MVTGARSVTSYLRTVIFLTAVSLIFKRDSSSTILLSPPAMVGSRVYNTEFTIQENGKFSTKIAFIYSTNPTTW